MVGEGDSRSRKGPSPREKDHVRMKKVYTLEEAVTSCPKRAGFSSRITFNLEGRKRHCICRTGERPSSSGGGVILFKGSLEFFPSPEHHQVPKNSNGEGVPSTYQLREGGEGEKNKDFRGGNAETSRQGAAGRGAKSGNVLTKRCLKIISPGPPCVVNPLSTAVLGKKKVVLGWQEKERPRATRK